MHSQHRNAETKIFAQIYEEVCLDNKLVKWLETEFFDVQFFKLIHSNGKSWHEFMRYIICDESVQIKLERWETLFY